MVPLDVIGQVTTILHQCLAGPTFGPLWAIFGGLIVLIVGVFWAYAIVNVLIDLIAGFVSWQRAKKFAQGRRLADGMEELSGPGMALVGLVVFPAVLYVVLQVITI